MVITEADLKRGFSEARPSTSDDVCVTLDGRRLDTPEKVRQFLQELNESRQLLDHDLNVD